MQINVTFYIVERDGKIASFNEYTGDWDFFLLRPTAKALIKDYDEADDVAKRFGGKVVEVRVVTPNMLTLQ